MKTNKIMKKNKAIAFIVSALSLSGMINSANGQTLLALDGVAAQYDIFNISGTLGGSGSYQFIDYKEGNFDGLFGVAVNSWTYIESNVVFGGEARYHSNAYDPSFTPHGSSTGTASFTGFDDELNAADTAIRNYKTYLEGLSSTASVGNISNNFSYTATTALTVLDFSSLALNGETFTLNGRAGQNDAFVIRVNGDAVFSGGSPVVLNNLELRNVIWLIDDNASFDLHKNNTANFEGTVFHFGQDNDDYNTIIGDVDFNGQLYIGQAKLGTGVSFTGASITDPVPEPSVSLLLFGSCFGLVFIRRRSKA